MTQPLVPGLFRTHPTLAALYARICAEPGADDPRLQFADAAQEAADDWVAGAESDREDLRRWARLIRVQYELERLGPAPFVIEAADLIPRGGPDYFTVDVESDLEEPFLKVGDRIDVAVHKYTQSRYKLKSYYHRLCVKKITPADGYESRLSLKRDEESTPYPREAVGALRAEADSFISPGDRSLWRWYAPVTRPVGLEWRWGFPSRLAVQGSDLAYLDRVVGDFPVREVEFKSIPMVYRSHVIDPARLAYKLVDVPESELFEVWEEGSHGLSFVRGIATRLVRRHWSRVTSWQFPA